MASYCRVEEAWTWPLPDAIWDRGRGLFLAPVYEGWESSTLSQPGARVETLALSSPRAGEMKWDFLPARQGRDALDWFPTGPQKMVWGWLPSGREDEAWHSPPCRAGEKRGLAPLRRAWTWSFLELETIRRLCPLLKLRRRRGFVSLPEHEKKCGLDPARS